ncbi:phage tail tape measure protein [Klebsiella oxytoca]|nr:hypothetical protein [Klebsiella oxytoca]SAQ36466.1 phage tail length tape-measure protein 1 [Klebsiella oxytoca]
MEQARNAGARFTVNANAIQNTVTTLAEKFGISEQRAFELSKQLSEVANNKSPEAFQKLVLELQNTTSSTDSGREALEKFLKPLTDLVEKAGLAQIAISGMRKEVDNLTAGQKNLIKQSERNLALSKLQGEARARLQAQYAAEDAGFAKEDPHARKMEDDAAATYKNTQAQKTLQSAQKKGASQAESIAQKLANLKQQSELAASSTEELSREQAMLRAEQSLGKSASVDQVQQARNYAAAVWDTAAAIKARNAVPELKENADYNAQKSQLEILKDAKDAQGNLIISQQQYNQASEQLEQQHQVNLAKIRAGQVVTPQQQAQGEIDPVQRLANQHAQELALIQQFETQKGQITQRGIELMNAANTQYEQQRTAAQWEMLSQQSLGYNMLTSAVDAFSGNASNAITGLLTGTMSAQEAMRSLGNTILNSVINSIVQVGVEALKNYILGQTLGAASVASSVGMAATTASAWAPAAALASLATLGTNAAPASAGITSTVGLASGLALAGGRKNGGPVSPGNIYPVGEDNLPEFVQTNKGLFMIPGDDGRVFSNKDVTSGSPSIKKASTGSEYVSSSKNSASQSESGGGKQIQVNVQFYDQTSGGQHSFEAQAMQEGNVVTVDAFLNDLDRGGPMTSGIKDRFGLSVKANGAY